MFRIRLEPPFSAREKHRSMAVTVARVPVKGDQILVPDGSGIVMEVSMVILHAWGWPGSQKSSDEEVVAAVVRLR